MNLPSVSDTWERGSPYEQYIGRWSRKVAPAFLTWLDVAPGKSWLDVGCGTGALCAAIVDRCSPARLVGVEPSEGFLKLAAQNLAGRAVLHVGSAAAIPLKDGEVDAVASGLVLNFVPDVPKALAEMRRVAKAGGLVAAYVWDYADKMELIRHFWDAAAAIDPTASPLHEGVRFPICNPAALSSAFGQAGLSNIRVTALDVSANFVSFEDYWLPFLGGQGPAPAYVMSLAEDQRSRLREAVRLRLPAEPDGNITLNARAWAIRATTLSDASQVIRFK
jgi:SAM-dependent methyltransferase